MATKYEKDALRRYQTARAYLHDIKRKLRAQKCDDAMMLISGAAVNLGIAWELNKHWKNPGRDLTSDLIELMRVLKEREVDIRRCFYTEQINRRRG